MTQGDNKSNEIEKFKFQANTALRMIDGLQEGRYGNHYTVSADEKVTCGLTPREIVAIGYNSLSDQDNWHNMGQDEKAVLQANTQHFMGFVEHLYIAKRGYNIDRYDENEWKTHANEPDDNKCTGGTINEIANGMRDHKMVEINIVSAQTMEPSLTSKLPDILNKIAKNSDDKSLINNWLITGIKDNILADKIIDQLKKDKDFSEPFSEAEITSLGSQLLNRLGTRELKENLAKKYPGEFSLTQSVDDKRLLNSFTFNESKGFTTYLEDVYSKSPVIATSSASAIDENQDFTRFNALVNRVLAGGIVAGDEDSNYARNASLLLELLHESSDKGLTNQVRVLTVEHFKNLRQNSKNQHAIMAAERGHLGMMWIQ